MQGLKVMSVRTKLVGGFVVVLLLMGTTLAVDIVASGNQAAISDRIVSHLDPARISAAKIVTLVRSIDDDGAWVVNSMSGDKTHSDQVLKTYYSEVDQLKTTVADALALADTDAQRAAITKFQAFFWGAKPLTDADRKTLDAQSKDVFTGSDSYLFGNEQIFVEARSGQYLKAAFDYTTVPFIGALDSAQIYIDAVQSQIDKATADVRTAASLTQTLSIGLGLLAALLGLPARPAWQGQNLFIRAIFILHEINTAAVAFRHAGSLLGLNFKHCLFNMDLMHHVAEFMPAARPPRIPCATPKSHSYTASRRAGSA